MTPRERELEDLAKLETNYHETLKETSQGGKVMSLTEYHERMGLVEEARKNDEEALGRINERRRTLRDQRNQAYVAIVGGLPEGRWIRNGSEAVRVEQRENSTELIRVLTEAVEKAPPDASVRRVVRISKVLEGGRGERLAYRLAPALPAAGSVFCWGTAAAIILTVSPDSVLGLVMMLPMLMLAAGGVAFGSLFYQQLQGELDDDELDEE